MSLTNLVGNEPWEDEELLAVDTAPAAPATAPAAVTDELAPAAESQAPTPKPIEDGDVFCVSRGASLFSREFDTGDWLQAIVRPDAPNLITFSRLGSMQIHERVTEISAQLALSDGYMSAVGMLCSPDHGCNRVLMVMCLTIGDYEFPQGDVIVLGPTCFVIERSGRHVGPFIDCPRMRRLLAHFSVPITDDGRFLDANHQVAFGNLARRPIPDGVRLAIERAPDSPITQVLIRNHTLVPPPKDAVTSEALFAWLDSLPLFSKYSSQQSPQPVPPAQAVEDDEDTVAIDVELTEIVYGSVNWSRQDAHTGTIDVPVSVLAQGDRAVRDYIRDNMEDLDQNMGEEDLDWDSSESGDSDAPEFTSETRSNIESAIERAREDYPDAFE